MTHRHIGHRERLGAPARRHMPLLLAAATAAVLTGCESNNNNSQANPALAVQNQMIQVAKQVGPSVVLIQDDKGLGSGVVFDTQGNIVTNNHVVTGAKNLHISLTDGKQYPAQVVGTAPANDLAVIRVNAPGLKPAVFRDSAGVEVGEVTMALGNPLGLQSTVTQGIVSAVERTVSEEGGVTLEGAIQTSAEINPGNSGGALVDLQGHVIGIPTLAATDPQLGGAQAPGIGFAIPSNTVRDVATQLVNK